MPRFPHRAASRLIRQQVVEQQHVPSAIGGQMGQHPDPGGDRRRDA